MTQDTASRIGTRAMEGLLFEVAATPKPGLVDRANSGAHHDMDFFTFLSSAAALSPCFTRFAQLGTAYSAKPLPELLPPLRAYGRTAETKMFAMTGGVNTHKGLIFSLGLLCGCAGWLSGKAPLTADNVCETAGRLCRGLCQTDYGALREKACLTKGERLYLQYGIKGVRGEAESGFLTVRTVSAPQYRALLAGGSAQNEALVQTLLFLLAKTVDTNVIARHGLAASRYVQASAEKALALGGMFTGEGRACIRRMDDDLIGRDLSPGGCADLLAATHFLVSLELRESRGAEPV
ncbi:MAG: triphosphoribosyl-dephospho-CoA synthase CitG [Oscillospiraceae bacterium]|nr:triphosphoribosyl-dephospho-CoA synthase CitG [Oscillospiraceae bacterium]